MADDRGRPEKHFCRLHLESKHAVQHLASTIQNSYDADELLLLLTSISIREIAQASSVSVETLVATGQLQVLEIEHDLQALTKELHDQISAGQDKGYGRIRIVLQPMCLTLTSEQLLTLESAMQTLSKKEGISVECHYMRTECDPSLLLDVTLMHNLVLTPSSYDDDVARDNALLRRKLASAVHHVFINKETTPASLPGRQEFLDYLRTPIAQTKRNSKHLFAVLYLDIDRFKVINDSLGPVAGDELLVKVAQTIQRYLQPGDRYARWSGDEFVILLDNLGNFTDAVRFSKCVQQELSEPVIIDHHEVFSSASIGISLSTRGYDKPEDIISDASTAMHRAKELGKSRHELFETQMRKHTLKALKLETDLRRSLDRDEMEMYYQPVVDLTSGKVAGFEALMRWNHPSGTLIEPAQFIHIAEESGLISKLGHFALVEACNQQMIWQGRNPGLRPLQVSVNVSVQQLLKPEFAFEISEILKETRIDPTNLALEITETTIMDNAELINDILTRLKDLGISLYIDDFGTGYSSLSYLNSFSLDGIKIDKSFVHKMESSSETREIVSTIVSLASKLNLHVVAEGIETSEQVNLLTQLDCRYAQGFWFSLPVKAQVATTILEDPAGMKAALLRRV